MLRATCTLIASNNSASNLLHDVSSLETCGAKRRGVGNVQPGRCVGLAGRAMGGGGATAQRACVARCSPWLPRDPARHPSFSQCLRGQFVSRASRTRSSAPEQHSVHALTIISSSSDLARGEPGVVSAVCREAKWRESQATRWWWRRCYTAMGTAPDLYC